MWNLNMRVMSAVWNWLDNATLGALVGAAGAFLLVVLTDWRRNRRIATTQLPALLRRLLVLATTRHEGATGARDSVSTDPRIRPMGNIGLPFPTGRIDRYVDLAGDHLTDQEAFALDNICFAMREADRLNAASRDLCAEIDRAQIDVTRGEGNKLGGVFGLTAIFKRQSAEEAVLLDHVKKSIKAYLDGRLNEHGGPI